MPVSRRIGVSQTAANGTAIAHCAIGNPRATVGSAPMVTSGDAQILDVGVRNACAEHDLVRALINAAQAPRYR